MAQGQGVLPREGFIEEDVEIMLYSYMTLYSYQCCAGFVLAYEQPRPERAVMRQNYS